MTLSLSINAKHSTQEFSLSLKLVLPQSIPVTMAKLSRMLLLYFYLGKVNNLVILKKLLSSNKDKNN